MISFRLKNNKPTYRVNHPLAIVYLSGPTASLCCSSSFLALSRMRSACSARSDDLVMCRFCILANVYRDDAIWEKWGWELVIHKLVCVCGSLSIESTATEGQPLKWCSWEHNNGLT